MTDPLYGPVDSETYRMIAATFPPGMEQHARLLFDATIVAVNYDQNPGQLDHLIHKWALTGDELDDVMRLVEMYRQPKPGGESVPC